MNAAALCGLDKHTKVSVAGEQYYVIDMPGYFEHVDGSLDGDVSLEPSASLAVVKFLGSFDGDSEAVVGKPIDQRS